jgi:enterochelin esterase-like enzyme
MNIWKFSFRAIFFLIILGTFCISTYSQENSRFRQTFTAASDDSSEFPPPPAGYDSYRPDIARGKITTATYHSTTVGVDRQALVYTPPGYSEDRKYNVLYLLHGIGGDEREWYNNGKPAIILDNLYDDQKLEPMIVVFPNGRAMVNDDPAGDIFSPDKLQAFETFEFDLLNDLIPFIDLNYPVLTGRENRALAGLSMGAGQALNFGLAHLDTFAWVASFSAAPNTKAPAELIPDPAAAAMSLLKLWISCGTNDGLLYISQQTHEYLEQHNVPHIYNLVEGAGHDWKVWKYGLYHFSQLIFIGMTGVTGKEESVKPYQLVQNYPNPFNPITTINYLLPDESYATLTIYDISGKVIDILVNAEKKAGFNSVTWNAKELPSGVYIARFAAGKFGKSIKLILQK